jgi:hypothetical protein
VSCQGNRLKLGLFESDRAVCPIRPYYLLSWTSMSSQVYGATCSLDRAHTFQDRLLELPPAIGTV